MAHIADLKSGLGVCIVRIPSDEVEELNTIYQNRKLWRKYLLQLVALAFFNQGLIWDYCIMGHTLGVRLKHLKDNSTNLGKDMVGHFHIQIPSGFVQVLPVEENDISIGLNLLPRTRDRVRTQ